MAMDSELALTGAAQTTASTRAAEEPQGYYMSIYSGEQIDAAVKNVQDGIVKIPSSTSGSKKIFQITVDDSGTIKATEVTA